MDYINKVSDPCRKQCNVPPYVPYVHVTSSLVLVLTHPVHRLTSYFNNLFKQNSLCSAKCFCQLMEHLSEQSWGCLGMFGTKRNNMFLQDCGEFPCPLGLFVFIIEQIFREKKKTDVRFFWLLNFYFIF